MIKVDLGRTSEKKKKSSSISKKKKVDFSALAKLDKSDLSGLILLAGAVALAFLPHLFLQQYKTRIEVSFRAEKRKLEEQKGLAQQELNKYQSYQQELKNFEDQKTVLTQRLDAINLLLKSRSEPIYVLDALSQSIPEGAWLSEVNFQFGESPSLVFSGEAYSSDDVTQLADKLSASIYLTNLKLNEMDSEGSKTDGKHRFSFTAKPNLSRDLAEQKKK